MKFKTQKPGHNRTFSSQGNTSVKDKKFKSKQNPETIDPMKETGKFNGQLDQSADIILQNSKRKTHFEEAKNRTTRTGRPKTGNGRYSKRSKNKNKSEERKDRKRIFSKSVDQSYHENSSIHQHNMNNANEHKQSKMNEDDYLSGTEGRSLISPSQKINRLIRESLKRNKENETLKIIEQILKEEDHLLKKEELEKLNNDVRKTNRKKQDRHKKKSNNKGLDENQRLKIKAYKQLKHLNKSKDKKLRKKSFVLEFKKIKQEIEEEIKQEKKTKNKKHYKSLFSSLNNPLSNEQISTRRIKLKNSKNSTSKQIKQKEQDDFEEIFEGDQEQKKLNIRKFIKDKQK